MSATENKIVHYLKHLPPGMIGLESINSVAIPDMTPGAYNLNYHVVVNEKKFIFRINIEQQSGLSNQIEVEFMVLKFLESQGIAPKAMHFDDSKKHFDFDILIEEYLHRKVNTREPLISLHWILWGPTKLCDLKNRRTIPQLVEVHEKKYIDMSGSPGPKTFKN